MIKNWITRYSFHYPRALAYMLQASEYNIQDYLSWQARESDFRHAEKRKQFVKTPKGILILVLLWLIAGLCLLSFLYFANLRSPAALIVLALAPYILAYGILPPLLFLKLISWPIESLIVSKAQRKLSGHKAIRIAVAGSYGKTTMREILKTILSQGKKVAAPPHNYNTPLGLSKFINSLSGKEEILIFELGEYYPGDVKKLCKMVQPDMGVITGINEAHLDKFKSLRRTVETIYELSDYLGKKPLYINAENKLAKDHSLKTHTLYSRDGVADLETSDLKAKLSGTTFTLNGEDMETKLLGLHQIGPLVAAAHIAYKLGLTVEQVKKGMKNTQPFDHRLQPRIDSNHVTTLDDSYNGNPDGVRAVIEFLASLKDHRRFYVTPGLVEMGNKSKKVHIAIGEELAKAQIEKVILIKNSVTPFIALGLEKANFTGELIWFEDAITAYRSISSLTLEGDVVVLQNDWSDQYQ